MADRIVQRISLEGAEDVQAKLRKTGEVGAKALAATNRTIEDSNSGLGKYGNVFASLNGKTEESRESIERVKKLVETIRPAAEKAGLELGGIGEFTKIGRGGVIALAAAVGGTLVAAIERAGDAARDQAQRLGTFTGSAQKGVETYSAIKKTASELEIPNSGLAAPFEQLTRANQRSGAGLGDDDLQGVLRTLFEGASADRVPLDKSQEGITTLLGGLREQGQLTPEASKAAQEIFPTLMKRLSEDLTKSFPDQVSPFTTPQVLKSLQTIGPQIAKDLEASKDAFPSSIEDSLNKLKSSAGNLGDALNGTTIVSTALDSAAKFVDLVAGGVKKVKDSVTGLPTGGPTVPLEQANRIREQRGFAPVQGPQQYPQAPPSTRAPEETPVGIRFLQYLFGIKGQAYQPEGSQTPEGASGPAPKWEAAGAAADKLGENLSGAADKAKSAEQVFDEFNKKGTEQLGVIGSKLATQQAKIDYEHKPEETDIQIGRDQLAVQNADIAKKSAQIGVQDAAKGKELASLAPEQAEGASRNAESRYTKALKNLRQLQGYDTRALQDNPLIDARNELADADTARRVAEVNRKYAYLEPQKADLAQQKAQTDLTSADYLQRDTSLKLTKDQQGRQLSTDVAGLRYAQAQLDEQQKIAKSGDVSVSLLDKILATLQGDKSRKEESREPSDRSGKSGDRTGRFGDAGEASGASGSTASSGERDLVGSDGVVNIPRGASQDEINRAFSKQRATRTPAVAQSAALTAAATESVSEPEQIPATAIAKEGFRAELDQSIEDLKTDWKSQRQLNAQLHNGSFESRTVGTTASPQARTPAGVSQVYPPPVRGHYDDGQQFVPDVPIYKGLGAGASIPATNDYEFAGRKNPAGPYQEGISAPVTFPHYNSEKLQGLPSEYPTGVPLPQPRPPEAVPLPVPRPPEAGQGQQSALPSPQDVASLGEAFRSLIEGISASINSAKQQNGTVASPEAASSGSEGASNASEDVADLGSSAGKADESLDQLTNAFSEAANAIRGDAQQSGEPTYAATGGLITGPGSTTSDSIPTMLSNKEFVVNAEDSQKNIGLLHAINSGKEIKFKQHLALGGPVGFMSSVGVPDIQSPSIAARSGDGEHLGTVDLRTNHGDISVGATHSTLDSLQKASVMAQLTRTGVPPSWSGA